MSQVIAKLQKQHVNTLMAISENFLQHLSAIPQLSKYLSTDFNFLCYLNNFLLQQLKFCNLEAIIVFN